MAIFNEAFLYRFKKTSASSHLDDLYLAVKRELDICSDEDCREAEFEKVISMLRASVDEANNKFSGIKITIKDTEWYNENDKDEYEKFLSKGGSINISTMDGSDEKDYGAYRHISRLLKQKVKESHEVNGIVGEDGFKHDCIIYYNSGIK